MVLALPAVAALVAGAGVVSAPPAHAATQRFVKADNFRFCNAGPTPCSPAKNFTITVAHGTRVTWIYKDSACSAVVACPGHNVSSSTSGGPTRKKDGAVLLSVVFNTPGTYHYFCSIHQSFGMTGTVKVT
jgi:plastocyanin